MNEKCLYISHIGEKRKFLTLMQEETTMMEKVFANMCEQNAVVTANKKRKN